MSQNLVNNATFYYQNVQLTTNCKATMKIYATYQHAQGTVTLAQSQNYTLSYNGLGKVVLFNSSDISNIYDEMSGVEISPICMN